MMCISMTSCFKRFRLEMAGFVEDCMHLFHFSSVIHFVGTSFLKLCSFTLVVKRYVCGKKEEIVVDGKRKRLGGEDESFACEVEGFFCFLSLGMWNGAFQISKTSV